MGYRGRKRRLKNFWSNAQEIMNSFMRGKTTEPVRRSNRWIRKGAEGRRIVVKSADHLTKTLAKNDWAKEKIAKSGEKPDRFKLVYPKGRVFMDEYWGVQEYFNKPNVEQIVRYFKQAEISHKRHLFEEGEHGKKEYLFVKQFLKNKVNSKITEDNVVAAFAELQGFTRGARDDALLQPHNVLVQGITRDGKLRLTIIDV